MNLNAASENGPSSGNTTSGDWFISLRDELDNTSTGPPPGRGAEAWDAPARAHGLEQQLLGNRSTEDVHMSPLDTSISHNRTQRNEAITCIFLWNCFRADTKNRTEEPQTQTRRNTVSQTTIMDSLQSSLRLYFKFLNLYIHQVLTYNSRERVALPERI